MTFPFPMIPPAGVQSASVVCTDSGAQTATQAAFTFSTKSLGTAATGRRIIVGVDGVQAPAVTISSLTVGGNAAAVVSDGVNPANIANSGNICPISLYIVTLAAGTTGDIVVTFSGNALGCAIVVWAAYDLLSSTATDTATNTSDPCVASIDVQAGGILVGFAASYAGPPTFTWTNLTERADSLTHVTTVGASGASDAFASSQSALSVTADPSAAATGAGLVLIALR